MRDMPPFERVAARSGKISTVLYLALPPLVAWLVSLSTDFGRRCDDQYFVTFAQVLPVLLVAVIVEYGLALPGLLANAAHGELARAQAGATISSQLWLFALAEGSLLYAIGAKSATTFLVLLPALAASWFCVDLVTAINRRLGLAEWTLVKFPRVYRERERAAAAMLRTRAAELEERAERIESRSAGAPEMPTSPGEQSPDGPHQ